MKKLHSLTGIVFFLFLVEHLFTNSQVALWLGNDGNSFVRAVNFLQSLPYLHAIEVFFLLLPILIHTVIGIMLLLTGKMISSSSDGSSPQFSYKRNHAFNWQRITAWVILFGIIAHVVQMRFLEYPEKVLMGKDHYFLVKLSHDAKLYSFSRRFSLDLYDASRIEQERITLYAKDHAEQIQKLIEEKKGRLQDEEVYDQKEEQLQWMQEEQWEKQLWIQSLEKFSLKSGEVIAVAPSFGVAVLFSVRDTFKSLSMALLYSVFVLASCFHAANGIWSASISWGFSVTKRAQRLMLFFSRGCWFLLTFLGLSAIWGTYLSSIM